MCTHMLEHPIHRCVLPPSLPASLPATLWPAPLQWDTAQIGDGTVGLGALQVRVMLVEDMKPRAGSNQHLEVPYGYLTGMMS
jgi:hypothetical protein